jgi:hypothetical protein
MPMSHIVSIKTRIRDPAALATACQRLGLQPPVQGTASLFAGQQATGLVVRLPGWLYPIVINTESGDVQCDTYNGTWGNPSELDKLLQAYAVEKARIEARRAGHDVIEQRLQDGSIRLTVQVGAAIGGAA